jgi:acyl dehydratase
LAFPLQVALMTERAFPFPLVGLVHVANAITVHRPVSVIERIAFTVRAADLRPHPAGRQLDLLTEVNVDGETVWSGRSTYLRRSAAPEKPTGGKKSPAAAPTGTSSQVKVPGDIGRRYGGVSGDRNPIHLYGLTAKAFGFPSAIAHGMWLKARTLASLEGRLADSFTADVAFKTPVLLPSTVKITARHEDDGWTLDVRNSRSGKPHLSGIVTAN